MNNNELLDFIGSIYQVRRGNKKAGFIDLGLILVGVGGVIYLLAKTSNTASENKDLRGANSNLQDIIDEANSRHFLMHQQLNELRKHMERQKHIIEKQQEEIEKLKKGGH